MPPRTRRFYARLADLPDSDVEMDQEDEIDVENNDEEAEVEDADVEGEEEEDDDEDDDEDKDEIPSEDEEDEDDEPIPSPRKPQPRLRIKLKLGTNKRITSSSNSTARPTPEVETTPSRPRGRRKVKSEEIESEDSMSPESEGDEDASASGSRLPGQPKRLTNRQAVLASMVETSHVSLGEGNRSKKKVLNESELALRREETARKRKNLTEKKLEDEKAETINRLLKKQTRPRNKRGTALDDRSPMPGPTRKMKSKVKEEEREEAEEKAEEEVMPIVEEAPPVMYRWTSSKKVDGESTTMVLSFSVPQAVTACLDAQPEVPRSKAPSMCAVEGCGQPRKYRLVKHWSVGACGMAHLKLLEGQ